MALALVPTISSIQNKGAPFLVEGSPHSELYSITAANDFLKEGVLEIRDNRKSVYIWNMFSYVPGFGIRAYRHVFSESMQKGYEGRITATATKSAHIFHLKMGMQPYWKEERALDYVYRAFSNFSWDEYRFSAVFDQLKKNGPLDKITEQDVRLCKLALCIREEGIDFASIELISNEELINRKDEVLNKRVNAIWTCCIEPLLKIIENTAAGEAPCTIRLRDMLMEMSEKGGVRWKNDFNDIAPFQSFREFEHLDLSGSQREKLLSGLRKAREKGVRI